MGFGSTFGTFVGSLFGPAGASVGGTVGSMFDSDVARVVGTAVVNNALAPKPQAATLRYATQSVICQNSWSSRNVPSEMLTKIASVIVQNSWSSRNSSRRHIERCLV